MIRQIDEALRELVRSRALDGADVEVVLDAPTTEWAARRNAPTVNLYLYDIREDTRWRERGWAALTGDGETRRTPAPRLFKLSYLVTAWTARPEDEHRLLDVLLEALLAQEMLPGELLGEELAQVRVPMTVGIPPPEDRGFADVWSSLGGQLKPSIDVVLTAPFRSGAVVVAGPPVEEPVVVEISDRRDGGRDRVQRRPRDAAATPTSKAPAPAKRPPATAAADAPARPPRARKRRST